MVNGYMPLPPSQHPYNLMTMLSSHSVMTLFRVVVCVPAVSYIFKKCGVSLLLGTPGVSCVTCFVSSFLTALLNVKPRFSH
jgi:hypothetical protein